MINTEIIIQSFTIGCIVLILFSIVIWVKDRSELDGKS